MSNNSGAASGDAGSHKISDKDLTITIFQPDNPAQPRRADTPVLKELYKKTGVKVVFETASGDNFDEKKNTLLATNNIPDVLLAYAGDLNDYAKTGIFLPLSDYFDKDMPNFKKLYEANPEIKKLTVDGKLYGLPILGKYQIDGAHGPMLRVDLLKKLNLPMPDSFDSLYSVLKKFKEAYPDTYPVANRGGTRNLLLKWSYAMGSGFDMYYDYDVNGGQYVFGPATQDFKEVLRYFNRLYTEKLLDPDYAITTAQAWREKLSSGKSLFYYDNNSFGVAFNNVLQSTDPTYKFDLIPPLKNFKGETRALKWAPHWLDEVYVISSKIKNPETVVRFFDYLYSEEGSDITNYGVLGEHYTKVNGENKIMDSVIEKYKDREDPAREMQGDLGTGLLGFSFYVDERPQALTSPPDLVRWSEEIAANDKMKPEVIDPPFNEDEIEKLKVIKTQVGTLVDQEMDKFIIGTRPIDDYDNFIKELERKGTKDMERIYNDALARLK